MNLVIDIGNTFVKLAVFEKDELKKVQTFKGGEFALEMENIFQDFPEITHSIIASVKKTPAKWMKIIKQNSDLLLLNATTPLPFKNNYSSPKTLGIDRIALAAAAVRKYSNQNVLVIDAGTCITYDFINKNGSYEGGAIAPGITLRYKALHNFTAKLPLLTQTSKILPLIGKNTEENMHIGVIKATAIEIDGFINEYKSKFADLTVILTGGDSDLLSKSVKNSIFAPSIFLLEGLNSILEFNKI